MSDTNETNSEMRVRELELQNSVLSREVLTLTESHNKIIKGLMTVQGLLAQFQRDTVRTAFLQGKLSSPNDRNILASLDAISLIVLPSPTAARGRKVTDDGALTFIMKLLSRDQSEPLDVLGLPLPVRKSFEEWRNYLHELVSHTSWGDVLESSNSVLKDNPIPGPSTSNFNLHVLSKSDNDNASGYNVFKSSGLSKPLGKQLTFATSSPVKKSRRIIVDTDSSETEVENSSDSTSSSSSDKSSASGSSSFSHNKCKSRSSHRLRRKCKSKGRVEQSLVEALRGMKLSKEVVPPRKFDPETGTSLRKFLSSYERYFDVKYDGTEIDKSLQLGYFLLGTAKVAYEAMNGSCIKYYKLKPKLIEWYNSDRTSMRQKKLIEFNKATMLPNDTYSLYTMRLEQLACKAFPNSRRERERHLKRKFKDTVSSSCLLKLEGAQSTLTMFGEKKLSWDQMKKVSAGIDRESREKGEVATYDYEPLQQSRVFYTRPVTNKESVDRHNAGIAIRNSHAAGNATSTRSRCSQSQIVSRSPPSCNWCRRRGHREDHCWAKLGNCTFCGKPDHQKESCPKYRKDRQCSICKGIHLDRDCPLNRHDKKTLLN